MIAQKPILHQRLVSGGSSATPSAREGLKPIRSPVLPLEPLVQPLLVLQQSQSLPEPRQLELEKKNLAAALLNRLNFTYSNHIFTLFVGGCILF